MAAGIKIWNRFYEDYLMPSRLNEYEDLLVFALDHGYQHLTLCAHFDNIHAERQKDDTLNFIHRHDIDSDCKTARKMWEIEVKHGVKSSFYFRLSTLDFGLMKEIHASGSEVGYHYEELAQYAKDFRIRDKQILEKKIPEIRQRFQTNLKQFESGCGFPILSVASHGDFVNRKLGIANHAIMNDTFLEACGLRFEAYNKKLIHSLDSIMSDTVYPLFYKPLNPFDEISKKIKTLYLLTHPRHWNKSIKANTRENWIRFIEGLRF
ncbi:MAG: hypothetical protein ACK5CY_02140 [Bacteroidia bacterium]|jgi:hypothetical protein